MSDDVDKKEPDGSQGQADTKALAELQKKIADLETAVEAEKQRKADAIAERDKEREKRKKESEGKAQYDEAKALYQEQIAELTRQLDEAKKGIADLEPVKTRWNEYETKRRESLLSVLPEDKREKFRTADLELLEEIASLVPNGQSPGAIPRSGGNPQPGNKKWSEMSVAEKADVHANDPARAQKLIAEDRLTNRR